MAELWSIPLVRISAAVGAAAAVLALVTPCGTGTCKRQAAAGCGVYWCWRCWWGPGCGCLSPPHRQTLFPKQ